MNAVLFLDEEIEQFEKEVTYKNVENQNKVLKLIEEITYMTIIKELSLDQAELYCSKLFKYYDGLKP